MLIFSQGHEFQSPFIALGLQFDIFNMIDAKTWFATVHCHLRLWRKKQWTPTNELTRCVKIEDQVKLLNK